MAIHNFFKGMVPGYTPILIVSCLASAAVAITCEHKQYFHTERQTCTQCTTCGNDSFVIRPCQYHHDTVCRPLSDFLRDEESSNRHRHRHRHRQQHHKDKVLPPSPSVTTSASNNPDDIIKNLSNPEQIVAMEVSSNSEAPFNRTENFIWDWQAIVLVSAVFACILFFLVMAIYSLHQAKQWRRLKENFDADVEELSARLSLMAASANEKGEFLDAGMGPIADVNYLNNRCVYLEQLLSERKEVKIGGGTKPNNGNVYIEETNGKT